MNWEQILEAALKAARQIAQKGVDEGRNLTAGEAAAFDEHMAKANEAKAKLKEIAVSDARYKAIAELGGGRGDAKAGQVLSFKGLAGQLKQKMRAAGESFGIKSLVASGSQVTPAQTLTSPVAMAQPATGLLDLLPVRFVDDTDSYSYLRQTTRTNNAAPVATGATKPTSVYTLTRVNGKLQVIAHLSEPVPEFWLSDSPDLERFLDAEMAYGLQVAVEDQVLNGDGDDPNLTGLLEVSGIQEQAWNGDQILTVRSAITKVEVLGYTASGLALHPLDWEAIETASVDEAHYALDSVPVDRAARKLWGVPVALTTAVEQGSGVLLSEGSATIVANRNLNGRYGVVGDDFAKNQVRARLEGRFGLEVYRPTGVVAIALADEEGGEG